MKKTKYIFSFKCLEGSGKVEVIATDGRLAKIYAIAALEKGYSSIEVKLDESNPIVTDEADSVYVTETP